VDWECCWDRENIEKGECPNIHEGDEHLLAARHRRILEKCCDCQNFQRDLARFRDSGHPLAAVFSTIYAEHQRQKAQIQSLASFLDSKTLEVRFLHELGSVLQSSVDLDEVLSVALTAITAGKGFGMNRAFLLITDRENRILKGYLGIGPRSIEEANATWDEISLNDLDLQSLAQNFRTNKLTAEREKFRDILDQLTIPLTDTDHLLIRALESKQPLLVENVFHNPDVSPSIAHLLGVDTFLLIPLIARNRRVGMIIADNCITRRPITDQDMRSIETFSFPVAFAIERAALYERLQIELNRVTEAGKKLKEQQELIVRMEKMALVGRITSSVAHSIRNPLMVIGGFARSILKNTPTSDPKRDFIESIVGEARHLEGVLDEILNYSDSLYPTRDFWDVNQLVETTLRDIQDTLTEKQCRCIYKTGDNLPLAYIDFKQLSYCVRTMIISDIDENSPDEITVRAEERNGRIEISIENRLASHAPVEQHSFPFSPPRDQGAGLGLTLCRSMLEKQGVPLTTIFPPEGGTIYSIALPTHKEDQT